MNDKRITDKLDFFTKNISETHSWIKILAMLILYISSIVFLGEYMTAITYYTMVLLSISSITVKVVMKGVSFKHPKTYYWISMLVDGLLYLGILSLFGADRQIELLVYMIGFIMVSINILTLNCLMLAFGGTMWIFGYTIIHLVINNGNADSMFLLTIIITTVYIGVLIYITKLFQKMRIKSLS